jgi:hypothetical protein
MELYCKETNVLVYLNIEYGSKYKGYLMKNDEKLYTISGDLSKGATIINYKNNEKIDFFAVKDIKKPKIEVDKLSNQKDNESRK